MACIRIERDEKGFEVYVTNPKIAKANESGEVGKWKDPNEEYEFDTWEEVKAFLDKVVESALPVEEQFDRAFEKAAKEAMNAKR